MGLNRERSTVRLAVLMAGASLGALLCGAPSFAATATATATAQSDQAANLETLTVVARRREETLLNVPVAATVETPQTLNQYGLQNLNDIANQVADLKIEQGGQGSGSFISVRGIGEGGDTSTDSSVSIDIDGISTDRARGVREQIFDLASVQVLKGPQSLYFGKNSPAGVVVLTSADPTDTFSGYGRIGYEVNAKELYGEVAVGGPVTDQLKVRLAFRGDDMFGGWVRNNGIAQPDPFHPGWTLPGNINKWAPEWKTYAARFTAMWTPAANFDATWKAMFSHYQDNGSASLGEVTRCATGYQGAVNVLRPTVVDLNSGCTLNGVTDHGQQPLPRLLDFMYNPSGDFSWTNTVVTGLTMNYRLPKVTLTSVTGLYWYEEANFDGSDPSVFAAYGGYDSEDYHSATQEFRFQTDLGGPVDFNGGAFFQYEDMSLKTAGFIFDQVPLGVVQDPTTGFWNNYGAVYADHGHTESGFIAVDWKILPNVDITGGARFTHQIKYGNDGYIFINANINPYFHLLPVGTRILGSVDATNTSPDATITWHPTHNVTLYAAYKTGFESGGYSNPTIIPAGTTARSFEYKPETSSGYELGLKAELFGGRLSGDLTLFRYDFNDLQVTQFVVATTSFIIGNAASARTEGAELQANWQATDQLSFNTEIAYDHAYYINYAGAQCFALQTTGCVRNAQGALQQNLGGQDFPLAPRWQGVFGAHYTWPIFPGWKATLNGDLRYNSGYQLGQGPTFVQNAFTLFDASLHIATEDQKWEFAINARNIANKLVATGAGATPFGPPGQFSGSIERPQQIYFEVTHRF